MAKTPLGRVEIDTFSSGEVTLSLRPEHVAIRPAQADERDHTGEVIAREFKGHDMTFRVRLGRREYLVQTDYTAAFDVGDRVMLSPRTAAAVVRTHAQVDSAANEAGTCLRESRQPGRHTASNSPATDIHAGTDQVSSTDAAASKPDQLESR